MPPHITLRTSTVDVLDVDRDLLTEILECAAVGAAQPGIDPHPERDDLIALLHGELSRDDE